MAPDYCVSSIILAEVCDLATASSFMISIINVLDTVLYCIYTNGVTRNFYLGAVAQMV